MVSMSTGDSSLTLGEDQYFTQYKCIVTLTYQICPTDIWIDVNSFTMLPTDDVETTTHFSETALCPCPLEMLLCCTWAYLCQVADWGPHRRWCSSSWSHHLQIPQTHPFGPLWLTGKEKNKKRLRLNAVQRTCRPTTWLALTDFVAALTQTWTTPCSISSTVVWDEVTWRI